MGSIDETGVLQLVGDVLAHEGTMVMTPNRFLKNAFERNERQIKEKLKDALSR